MKNYEILKKLTKTQILERLVDMSIKTYEWQDYEETADHITWLFQEMTETTKFYLLKEEFMKDLPFQEGEENYDELAENQRNEHTGYDASLPES